MTEMTSETAEIVLQSASYLFLGLRVLHLRAKFGFVLVAGSTAPKNRELIRTKVGSARTQRNYGKSDNVTIIGVWSEGFSYPRGPLSISQLSNRSASVGDNRK
jgi:hypothetical protein